MSRHEGLRPESQVIHAGPEPDPVYGAVTVPIYQTSTFAFRDADQGARRFAGIDPGYIYTRLGNPTIRALERAVCELEGGHDALVTASGMAAVSTVFLALLASGDHVVGTDSVYSPTRLLLERHLARFGIRSTWVASERIDEVAKAVRPETRLLFIETPANPTIKLSDLEACSEIARHAKAYLVVDNTFSSPLLQKPFRHGADIVLHSMTKYLNGHTDVVAGVLVSRDEEIHQALSTMLRSLGGTADPHQAWLVLRGLRTLSLRLQRAQENAEHLARWLESHPAIAWVSYPGLESHPQFALARRQMEGPGAMISFGVRGGLAAAKATINSVRLMTLAVSLGGIETLIEHPASMTHASLPPEERAACGISDDLVRLSVGCEAFEDLRDDLAQALALATAPGTVGKASSSGAAR